MAIAFGDVQNRISQDASLRENPEFPRPFSKPPVGMLEIPISIKMLDFHVPWIHVIQGAIRSNPEWPRHIQLDSRLTRHFIELPQRNLTPLPLNVGLELYGNCKSFQSHVFST